MSKAGTATSSRSATCARSIAWARWMCRPCAAWISTWRKGEFLSIIGPSGSGKSTLFHVIGGLTPPTTGKVVVGDQDLSAMTDAERTQHAQAHRGIRLPEVQPAAQPDGARQYRGGALHRRHGPQARARVRGGSAPARHRRAAGSQTERALRRRAAARRDRARDRESSGDSAWPTSRPAIWTPRIRKPCWKFCAI